MGMKIIILKNTTGSDITIYGRVIPVAGERDFSEISPRRLAGNITGGSPSITIVDLIDAGDIIVNDGSKDLTSEKGLSWLFGGHVSSLTFEYIEDNTISTTTSTNAQQKLRMSLTSVSGDHLIEWSAEVRVAQKGRRIGVRVQLDDSININDTWTNPSINTDDWGAIGGFCKFPLTTGAHTIDVDFASSNAGSTVGIRNARIKVTRAI